MPVLEINVSGECQLTRAAERAFISVRVSADSTDQEEAAHNATRAVNVLHAQFRELSPKTETGDIAPDAPITIYNIGSITTSSRIPTDRDDKPTGPRQYSAFASLSAVFRDFSKLAQLASQLFTMPFVEVRSIDWRLTDATTAELTKEARKKALLDAIEKATLFSQVVKRDVSVVEINDQDEYSSTSQPLHMPRYFMARAAEHPGPDETALELEPQEIVVTASIKAKFATAEYKRPNLLAHY
ncbi:hypothetical protein ACJ72_03546 [Emergomyces africanus]|uniref:DUF541 domain-containing protein n=1 Tax=Emergomyces africanus TaxID=1955775 RepID=A0A1B7NZA3_9EURO|nr:hypothetical protein ACJ72_03546 [Emergomyces africanus]